MAFVKVSKEAAAYLLESIEADREAELHRLRQKKECTLNVDELDRADSTALSCLVGRLKFFRDGEG